MAAIVSGFFSFLVAFFFLITPANALKTFQKPNPIQNSSGDGETDLACRSGSNQNIALSNGNGFEFAPIGSVWLENWCPNGNHFGSGEFDIQVILMRWEN